MNEAFPGSRPPPSPTVQSINEIEVRLVDRSWGFVGKQTAAIESHWEHRRSRQPELFDGDILLLHDWSLHDGHFRGQCLQTDFKSFLFWREHHNLDRTVFDFFPVGALHSAEGWLILGRSGPTNSNPGRVYPPCGSLHPSDCRDDVVDLDHAIVRELHEETGLSLSPATLGPPLLIAAAPQVVIVRPIAMRQSAEHIVKSIEGYLRTCDKPEIAEIIVVRSCADIDPVGMPPFTAAYIEYCFAD